MAVASGLAFSLGACSITIGDGGTSSGSDAGDTAQTTGTTQPTGSNSGSDAGSSGSATDTTSGADVDMTGTGSSATGTDASADDSATSAPAEDMSILGHWQCVTVWANGSKKDAKDDGRDSNYYDFYADGTVLTRTGTVAPVVQVGEYSQVGTTGTITYPSAGDSDDEKFEISRTSDGTGLAMKVSFKNKLPDVFYVYKRMGDAPAFNDNPDSAEVLGRIPSGNSNGASASTSATGTSDSSTGTTGSSSSDSSDNTSAHKPGDIVNGWEWA